VRSVELAIYADTLAAEAASLAPRPSARASRLRQAADRERAQRRAERRCRRAHEALGLFGGLDERATRAELRELEAALDALEELQAWVEAELAEASAA
jgi:Spy/CpxP family protein refolding chaperone